MRLIALSLVIGIILASCTTRTVYLRVAVPLPPTPTWVKISGDELQCLSTATFIKLVEREEQHYTYEDRLVAKLKATQ